MDAAAGEAEFAGEHVEVVQASELARAEVEANDVGEVAATEAGVQAQRRRFAGGDGAGALDAAPLGLDQSVQHRAEIDAVAHRPGGVHERQAGPVVPFLAQDRKSTRLNSSHDQISYAVFCLKKK